MDPISIIIISILLAACALLYWKNLILEDKVELYDQLTPFEPYESVIEAIDSAPIQALNKQVLIALRNYFYLKLDADFTQRKAVEIVKRINQAKRAEIVCEAFAKAVAEKRFEGYFGRALAQATKSENLVIAKDISSFLSKLPSRQRLSAYEDAIAILSQERMSETMNALLDDFKAETKDARLSLHD